jgi:hypothetical protein
MLKDIIEGAINSLNDDTLKFYHKSLEDVNIDAFEESDINTTLIVLNHLPTYQFTLNSEFTKYSINNFQLRVVKLDDHFNDTQQSQDQVDDSRVLINKIIDLSARNYLVEILQGERITVNIVPEYNIFGSNYTGVVATVSNFRIRETPYLICE